MPFGVDTVHCQDFLKICFKTTTDSSVQWLQFILHRFVSVKKKLTIKLPIDGILMELVENMKYIYILLNVSHIV